MSADAPRARSERLRAHARRDVQRLQRRAGHDSSLAQAHARLDALDRGGEVGVPRQRRQPVGGGAIEIAFNRQTAAQVGDRRPLGVGIERPDVGRPAACGVDRRIAIGRLGGQGGGVGRERR